MDFLLTYVLQVNLLLVIVYIGYILLLKNLTFYQINRGYFILGVTFSFIYPFLDIKSLFQQHIEPVGEVIHYLPEFFVDQSDATSVFTLNNLLLVVMAVGSGVFIIRLLVQLLSLLRIHLRSEAAVWKTFMYRNVLFPIVPFSFFNKIYVNKQQHRENELLDIFKHEDIHVKGRHTFDILFTEIVFITCWYNPVVWLMRKAVRQNLEFLTDQQVLDKGVDRQVYQYSLLNVSKQGLHAAIANQFNFKMLKRRIMMMNKKRSSRLELSKYAFLIPVFVFVAGAFTVSKADDKIIEVVGYAKSTDMAKVLHKPDVERVKTVSPEAELALEEPLQVAPSSTDTCRHKTDGMIPSRIRISTIRSDSLGGPLIIIDGARIPSEQLGEIKPDDIESVDVYKDASSFAEYGEEGKNGVVVIKTKQASGKLSDTTKVRLRGKVEGLRIVQGRLVDSLGNEKKPLMVLDGERMPSERVENISPDDIESISILRDASAVALYGEEGKDGVVLITTKVVGERVKTEEKISEVVVQGYGTRLQNKPLVIVNGKVVNLDLNSINTEKIESIKTLTKEEATALYGDKGKNGAVIVITKDGKDLAKLQRPAVSGTGHIQTVTVVGRKIQDTKK